jgi:hypothetical protein
MKNTTDFNNLKEFINYIITKQNIDSILDEFETQGEKGFVFERLFDLVIKFGYCQLFPSRKYKHIISNVNNGKIKVMKNLQKYLTENKVSSGNSGGCSDISLYDEVHDKYIFISSKYPKCDSDKKSIKTKPVIYYDIQNILAMINENLSIYKNYSIYLLVPSKSNLLEVVKNANKSSEYITKYMSSNNILDKSDLEKYFSEFKKDLLKYKFDEYNEIFMSPKDKLIMRFHQKLVNMRTMKLIEEGEKQILWGLKCRSGKTYCCADLIREKGENKKINVLIITPAPTETTPQFEDVFENYVGFSNFNIWSIKSSKEITKLNIDKDKSNIFIISKQLLQNYICENAIKEIKNLKLNLIFSDENHFGSTTNLAKEIFNSYTSKNTVKIYLTATYNKPLKEWGIPNNCQMFWDIEDEQICKAICESTSDTKNEVNKLKDKHGAMVDLIINEFKSKGYTEKEIFEPYLSMPDLHLITSLFDSERYDEIKEKIQDSHYGFSFESLFSLTKNKKKFNYELEVKTFLRYISGSNKEKDFKFGDNSILNRINKTCLENESRLPFTQIWFLPPTNIDETSKALKTIMTDDNILSEYNIYSINSKSNDISALNIKETIIKYEKEAIECKKKGLILLAGNMLSLGITLSNCDIVMLLNNTLSSDKVMQQMYRSMTEGINKKYGFVVDMNISRVLNTCINYSVEKKDLTLEDKIKYIIDYHLINIDVDMWKNKELNSERLIKKLLDIWKNDPINNLRTMLKNLDNEYLEFDNDTQKLLNKSFTSSANDKMTAIVEFKDEDETQSIQSIQSGKEINQIEDSCEKELTELEKDLFEEERKEKEISFTKDVLPFVIPLSCILTMNDTNKDFIKMLSDIKANPELLEIFDEQSLIWWNKKDLITIIINIVEKYINKNSNTFNISINFKMGLKSLIDKPKELLELINECLKPKEVEKKKFGEVFTPMKLVNEILDKLPKEVWTNKNLTWFDPCVGMGNFMIGVYLRLMEGLKKEIPNEKQRKKHIIEKMIFMCELNKKNCYIVKQIFDINKEYKLNIYNGDYLKYDSNKIFKVDKFDIIVGNPPYNKDDVGNGNMIWHLFVEKSLEEMLNNNGYLVFVHPSLWRKPQSEKTKMRKFFNLMTKLNQMLYLEIHNTKDGLKTFGCGTRYDFYVIEKKPKYKKTTILDENKEINNIDLKDYNWLPNCDFKLIDKLIAKNNDEKLNILNDFNYSRLKKDIVSTKKDKDYKYELIYLTPKNGIRYMYSKINNKGHFGVSKVIIGETGMDNAINDWEGKYGMTQDSFGILINSKEEGEKILKVIKSEEFKKLIKIACSWSNFRIDWRLFLNFKKDFYKYFIENKVIKRSILKKVEKNIDTDSEEEKPKIIKVKKNKSTVNKT